MLRQARLFKRWGADPYPVHRAPLATARTGQERPAVPGIWNQGSEGMNESTWQLIMASAEPVPMPAVNSNGPDVVRQLRAALWQAGHITLSLDEVRTMVD